MNNLIANCFFVIPKKLKIICVFVFVFISSQANSNETLTSKIELLQEALIQVTKNSNQVSNNLKKRARYAI